MTGPSITESVAERPFACSCRKATKPASSPSPFASNSLRTKRREVAVRASVTAPPEQASQERPYGGSALGFLCLHGAAGNDRTDRRHSQSRRRTAGGACWSDQPGR